MSRDGLFLRVRIADAARDAQMAQRISAKVRITVMAVGLSDANVSRETVIKFRRTKREQFQKRRIAVQRTLVIFGPSRAEHQAPH
jgi:hypothetical protein